jgi:hypothetical protein
VAVAAEPEQQLAWEARQRPRAAIAAIAAGVLTLASLLWSGLGFRDAPRAWFVDSLANLTRPGPIGDEPSVRTPVLEFYDDHALTIIGSAVVRALSLLALAWAITFLAAATRARRSEFPRLFVYVPLVGAVLNGIAGVLGALGTMIAVGDFLDGPETVDAARDVGSGTLLITANIINYLAPLILVAGIFLVALNAMRAGLLTRFLGFLGIIGAAALLLLPVAGQAVQSFWLPAVGLLMLGAVRGGLPPAWRTGRAEPWQTAPRAPARQARAPKPAAEPQPEPERVPAGRPHPASKKRKRKRRG